MIAGAAAGRPDGEAGTTIIELSVAMTVLTVVMTIFTAGILQIYRTTNASEARSSAQSQVGLALLRLDKQLRYAAEIGAPRPATGTPQYVEIQLPMTNGVQQCLQLRVSNGLLQQRTWTSGVSPVVATGWSVLASGVTSPRPFTLLTPIDTDAIGYQRLRMQLAVASGAGANRVAKTSDITFTAQNSSRESGTTPCAEGWTLP